jgi:hypothetical protein
VLDAAYSPESFGSWVVTAATSPIRRLVWDGKESWLIVQKTISLDGSSAVVWEDSWIKRSAGPENLSEAVEAIFQ